MKKTFAIALLAAALGGTSAFAIEPIPGSITYTNPSKARLMKSPVGSSLSHSFYADGNRYNERYIVQPDHSLKLVGRWESSDG
ncbi:hypothetical protein CYG48_17635 (plasmid) [Neorhizobium sp. SOG26]|jgi:hypothetical protein|uniref:Uncharacterized protein n=1 Tax=Neorhizobium turbinariae TaxID=2937795 RepID=A0ABT0IQ93_9HYPH|nr:MULTISPECIES: hypothetical protein [Neorhizobium]AXV17651.1 hypothetical protein CYG48_17635 [Neorhizobium sp. SOG26]MCK8780019.1 hypothetical protein [Neorhizobium turbinariae]